jgi:hypothetical protein
MYFVRIKPFYMVTGFLGIVLLVIFMTSQESPSYIDTLPETLVRVLLVTTWSSGSTFTAGILHSYPLSYYSYEPLSFANWYSIYNNSQENVTYAINIIKGLSRCNYSLVFETGTVPLNYKTRPGSNHVNVSPVSILLTALI